MQALLVLEVDCEAAIIATLASDCQTTPRLCGADDFGRNLQAAQRMWHMTMHLRYLSLQTRATMNDH